MLQPSPTKNPLLRMLRCDRVAPLGKPVVPLVYWMLIGSVGSQRRAALAHLRAVDVGALLEQLVPRCVVQEDGALERGDAAALTSSTIAT